jgi:rubrerythrin
MLPANLTPLEVIDVGIHGESLAYRMYDALARRVDVPTIQGRLVQLKKDEKDHRKTLRAHRRAIFGPAPVSVAEEEAAKIFGVVDVAQVRDKESLIQALYGALRFEEYAAYYYDKLRYKLPSEESRIFFDVLASEGAFHATILKQQIEAARSLDLALDEKGRALEMVPPPPPSKRARAGARPFSA